MSLILIRHGATDNNGAKYIGRQDIPLNELGRRQAVELARSLADRRIGRIWVSPLSRAIETARPLAQERGLAMVCNDALVEFDFGDMQGQDKSADRVKLRRRHAFEPVPGGESLFDVWHRLGTVAERALVGRPTAMPIAIVGHYWSLRLLRGRLLGRGFEETLKDRGYKPAHAEILWLD